MAIQFTQFMRPHGDRRDEAIDRPAEIETLAHRFIAAGGCYECEILTTGQVSLTAVFDAGDGPRDIAIKIRENGPGLIGPAVDDLVRESVQYIEALAR